MTKRETVLQLLQTHKRVTTSMLLRGGAGSRYGARVRELREMGYEIHSGPVRAGEYWYELIQPTVHCYDATEARPGWETIPAPDWLRAA